MVGQRQVTGGRGLDGRVRPAGFAASRPGVAAPRRGRTRPSRGQDVCLGTPRPPGRRGQPGRQQAAERGVAVGARPCPRPRGRGRRRPGGGQRAGSDARRPSRRRREWLARANTVVAGRCGGAGPRRRCRRGGSIWPQGEPDGTRSAHSRTPSRAHHRRIAGAVAGIAPGSPPPRARGDPRGSPRRRPRSGWRATGPRQAGRDGGCPARPRRRQDERHRPQGGRQANQLGPGHLPDAALRGRGGAGHRHDCEREGDAANYGSRLDGPAAPEGRGSLPRLAGGQRRGRGAGDGQGPGARRRRRARHERSRRPTIAPRRPGGRPSPCCFLASGRSWPGCRAGRGGRE